MSSSGLEEALAKARDTLASGALTSEAQVRAAVIAPLLNALGWDPADPNQWLVEYPVGTGRVDDALLGPKGTALVFVEVKRPGALSPKAEDQLFGYANNKGVPLLVLTDGDTWDLYLSMAAGEPAERRFAHLTLTESDDLGRVAQDMREFIGREEVLSGTSEDAAKERLKQVKDREIGKSGLDLAWQDLLREPDEMLRDLLIERVEQDVGSRPGTRDAEEFLRRHIQPTIPSPGSVVVDDAAWLASSPAVLSRQQREQIKRWLAEPVPSTRRGSLTAASENASLRGVLIQGVEHAATKFARIHLLLAGELQSQNASFLREYTAAVRPGTKNPRAVRASDQILTGSRRSWYQQVPRHPEWYLHTKRSASDHQRLMREMTEIAGWSWGQDVVVLFDS